jgi:hypothetical protein
LVLGSQQADSRSLVQRQLIGLPESPGIFSAGLTNLPAAVPLVHAKCLICRGIFVGTQVA